MKNVAHSSTAKATIRDMIAAHGRAKTLAFLTEVLAEELSTRRGRPTRAQAAIRKAGAQIDLAVPHLLDADAFKSEEIDSDSK